MNEPRAPKPKTRLLRAFVGAVVALQALLAMRRWRRAVSGASQASDAARMDSPHSDQPEVKPVRTFVWAFVGLQVLLAFTVGSAFVNLGAANTAINLLVAVTMMLLLMTLFMHESKARTLTALVSAAGVLWVILMIGLALADYLTRVRIPPPWS